MNRHFFFVCTSRTTSRTYGGSNYTLAVYENKGRGKFVHLGNVSACTRAHKGEVHEAWGVVLAKFPRLGKRIAALEGERYQSGHYSWQYRDLYGVRVDDMGGAS